MTKRRVTPGYIFFYILFSADSWRLLFGIILALVLTPLIAASEGLSGTGRIMIAVMLTAIGWAVSAYPAKKITGFLMGFFKKKVTPG